MLSRANYANLEKGIVDISQFTSCADQSGVTRMVFSEADLAARMYINFLMPKTGLIVSEMQ
jgi:hypothetical protein